MKPGAIPVFFAPNPVTGKPVSLPSGAITVGDERLLPAPAIRNPPAPSGDLDARIKEAERRLAVSKAWDGAENMNSAYGDYLDDLDFGPLGKLFARNGTKEVPFSGVYVGRERIIARDATSPPPGSRPRVMLPLHWRTQPVILVADDGRSASIRSRLFQPASSRTRAMGFGAACITIRSSSKTACGSCGASRSTNTTSRRRRTKAAGRRPRIPIRLPRAGRRRTPNDYPPDIPLTMLGERERGFRGGTGEMIVWPAILPMWFHYKNPVSGRVPEHYWPDCITCMQHPETSMKNHGYLLPPS